MAHRRRRLGQVIVLLAALPFLLLAAAGSAQAQAGATPLPPLAAWEVAADGGVFVLDAQQRIYALDPQTLAPLAASDPLAPGFSGGSMQMALDNERLFVAGERLDGIHVLDRQTLREVAWLPHTVTALAVEPDRRLFLIERQPSPMLPELSTFAVATLPLDDLQTEPQPFGPAATQPFGSLFDLAIDKGQNLLYVGTLDSSGSPNRHHRTYRAYDLASGAEIDTGLPRQSASTALRPAFTGDGTAAVSYAWEGVFPGQRRIYLVERSPDSTAAGLRTVEHVSGPAAIDAEGHWLYVVHARGLWVLENFRDAGYFLLRASIPFLQQPPADLRLSPDGQAIYLFGNGWLAALDTTALQQTGIASFAPFPTAWTSPTSQEPQAGRLFAAADAGATSFVNLQPANEWYRSDSHGDAWQLLAAVQQPHAGGIDRLSLSPNLAQDGVVVGRGVWQEERRTIWRSQDAGMNWERWTPPIAYVAGGEGARTLYIQEADSEPRSVPLGGSSENPAWSSGWTHLAFQNNGAGDWEIYRAAAACQPEAQGPSAAAQPCDVQRLTDSAGDDLLPAWSPDGRMIAFVSLRDGNPEIYVMLADGSQQTRLTFAPGGDWRPAWLPDSRHLVFTSDRSGNNDILLLQSPLLVRNETRGDATPNVVVATSADERDPAVNGNGELLYLSDRDGMMQPYSADLAAYMASSSRTPVSGTRLLPDAQEPIGHPAWLPDGNLLFASGGAIYSAAPYAPPGEWQEISAPAEGALHPTGGPAWSWPDAW